MQDQLIHDEITRRIIGCAMRAHTALGTGFRESVYQRSLAIEMSYEGLAFEQEKDMPIYYRDVKVGSRRTTWKLTIRKSVC
jgi:GxxExxY protein